MCWEQGILSACARISRKKDKYSVEWIIVSAIDALNWRITHCIQVGFFKRESSAQTQHRMTNGGAEREKEAEHRFKIYKI